MQESRNYYVVGWNISPERGCFLYYNCRSRHWRPCFTSHWEYSFLRCNVTNRDTYFFLHVATEYSLVTFLVLFAYLFVIFSIWVIPMSCDGFPHIIVKFQLFMTQPCLSWMPSYSTDQDFWTIRHVLYLWLLDHLPCVVPLAPGPFAICCTFGSWTIHLVLHLWPLDHLPCVAPLAPGPFAMCCTFGSWTICHVLHLWFLDHLPCVAPLVPTVLRSSAQWYALNSLTGALSNLT